MNDKLAKWGSPFECPSETQQLGESNMKIIQKAQVAKLGDNGSITVNMQQNPNITYNITATKMRDTLKVWINTLPEPRWSHAKAYIAGLALEICEGNEVRASQFLGKSRRIINYSIGQMKRKRKIKELMGE